MKKILILTASFGDGHNAAARNLRDAIELISDEPKSEWGKNTLFLWENQEIFAPILDAWEIANRNNIFTPVGLNRFAFLANSDFHKPKHIYSWETLLHCEKDAEAIKDCIRRNEHVSLTLYLDGLSARTLCPVSRTPETAMPDHLSLNSAIPA